MDIINEEALKALIKENGEALKAEFDKELKELRKELDGTKVTLDRKVDELHKAIDGFAAEADGFFKRLGKKIKAGLAKLKAKIFG